MAVQKFLPVFPQQTGSLLEVRKCFLSYWKVSPLESVRIEWKKSSQNRLNCQFGSLKIFSSQRKNNKNFQSIIPFSSCCYFLLSDTDFGNGNFFSFPFSQNSLNILIIQNRNIGFTCHHTILLMSYGVLF